MTEQCIIRIKDPSHERVVIRPVERVVVVREPVSVRVLERTVERVVSDRPPRVIRTLEGPRGLVGPPGAGGVTTVVAASVINAYHVVALDFSGLGYMASADTVGDFDDVLGVATAAALAGESIGVKTDGVLVTEALWVAGPLFLGIDGALTANPSLSLFQLQVAVALNSTTLIVRPQTPIGL